MVIEFRMVGGYGRGFRVSCSGRKIIGKCLRGFCLVRINISKE